MTRRRRRRKINDIVMGKIKIKKIVLPNGKTFFARYK